MHFPFSWRKDSLLPEDLDRLAPFFCRAVRRFLCCKTVRLEPAENNLELAGNLRHPEIDSTGSSMILPLWDKEQFLGVAVASGGDPGAYLGRSRDWLRERGDLVCREMRLLKQWSIDPVTGLFNGRILLERLQMLQAEAGTEPWQTPAGHLMLIEIYPRARNAEQGLLGIARIGSQIEGLLGGDAPLHHLGAGIFAQVRPGIPEDQLLKIGNGVLRWLKRESVARGHIGIAPIPIAPAGGTGQAAALIVEHAWLALGVARRRAPHALCTHGVFTSGKGHPFHEISPEIGTELKRRWRKVEQFSLILLHQDQETAAVPPPRPVWPGSAFLPLSVREGFVFLPGADERKTRRWIAGFRKERAAAGLSSCSMGVALFPCAGFKKKDMVLNARKALLHGRFFGPGSATFFDGASLNISGDVYYEEGDLARAIEEYRRGLELAPASVNLLNSLGVAYAQMNRYRKAIPLFERVLALEPENLMALFNLGYAHLFFNQAAPAVDYFTRALVLDKDNFDLLLQLGKLHCQAGNFREAAGFLTRAVQLEAEKDNGTLRGRGHFHLGLALSELGQTREAMVHLQRAVRHNPHDAGAISLLGELYALEDQGEEIARALCRQGVEIDDSKGEHWRRLGLVHWRCGENEAAVAALRRSLRLDRHDLAALRLLGRIYRQQGRFFQARLIYQRLHRLEPGDRGALEALEHLAACGKRKPARGPSVPSVRTAGKVRQSYQPDQIDSNP